MSFSVKAFLTAMMIALLAGCTETAPVRPDDPVPTKRPVAAVCHARIAMSGRFSVAYNKDGKDESAHGSFRWGQDRDNLRVEFISPLGQTLAIIDVTADSATLTESGKAPRTAEDVDALVLESLGWPLPVAGLRDWMQACMRDARARRIPVTPENRELVTSDGWRVTYPVWVDADDGSRRPKRIDLHRSGRQVSEISVKLVIDDWLPRR